MSLRGRSALVTGGGRGIGAAIARRLAALGARVAVTGRTVSEIDHIAAEVGGVAFAVDLSDRAATDQMIAAVGGELGRVDILVNNAGAAHSAPFGKTGDDEWDRMLELNATAPFRVARALVPAMAQAGWGRVINVASNAGVTGYRYTAAYCAAKHAVVGLTRALAVELASSGVTVNAVCPGWTATALVDEVALRIAGKTGRTAEASRGELAKMNPQNRILEPTEVAEMVAYLCSEAARGVHGQALVIDGGQVIA